MKKYLLIITLIIGLTSGFSQNNLNPNPEDAQFITTDIENFWTAFDRAKDKDRDEQIKIYQREYIDKATKGFKSWIDKREHSAESLVDGINKMIPFYESIRANTKKIEQFEKDARAGFYALEYLYPDALFPDVYFFIWYFFDSGSTTTDEGLMIATEGQTISTSTPMDVIPEIHREMVKSMNLDRLASLVVHESIHVQQDYKTTNLLEKAIKEGSCDFIAELCTGQNPSASVHGYANAREKQLWGEFKTKMKTNEMNGWTGIPQDRPAGLAYWMGYKIIEAYYQKQSDKRKAVHNIIRAKDYQKIFEESEYAEKFEK